MRTGLLRSVLLHPGPSVLCSGTRLLSDAGSGLLPGPGLLPGSGLLPGPGLLPGTALRIVRTTFPTQERVCINVLSAGSDDLLSSAIMRRRLRLCSLRLRCRCSGTALVLMSSDRFRVVNPV